MQQNRIKTLLHRNTNDRRCSNIPRSSPPIACPTRSETEEHSHWLGRGTPPQSGLVHHVMRVHFGVLNHLIRCRQLDCSACLTRWSFHVEVVSNARHRHIPYERPAIVPGNQCQPTWAFSVRTILTPDGSLKTVAPAEARDFAMTSLRWYSSAWCSLTIKIVAAKWVDLWTKTSLVRRHTKVQPDSNYRYVTTGSFGYFAIIKTVDKLTPIYAHEVLIH